jgi:hypothetical protein
MAHCTPAPGRWMPCCAVVAVIGVFHGQAVVARRCDEGARAYARERHNALAEDYIAFSLDGRSLQDPPGFAAAGRLQGWSWTEAGLSLQSRITAVRRSGSTGP